VKQDNGSKHTSKIIVALRKTTREVANDYLTQTTGRKLQRFSWKMYYTFIGTADEIYG